MRTVTDNPAVGRFELYVDELLAGIAEYEPAGQNRAFTHTEIYPRYEGQGLAKVLIQAALDQTKAAGLGVLPFCPFVHHFVQTHADYLELVPIWARERLGLDTPS